MTTEQKNEARAIRNEMAWTEASMQQLVEKTRLLHGRVIRLYEDETHAPAAIGLLEIGVASIGQAVRSVRYASHAIANRMHSEGE